MHPGERLDYAKYDIRYIVTLKFGKWREYQFDFFNCYSEAIDFVNTVVRRYNSALEGNAGEEMTATIEAHKEEKEETQ